MTRNKEQEEREKEKAMETVTAIRSEIVNLKLQVDSLNKVHERESFDKQKLKSTSDDLQQKIIHLESENNQLQMEMESLQQQLNSNESNSKSSTEKGRKEVDDLKSKIKFLEDDNRRLQQTVSMLQIDNEKHVDTVSKFLEAENQRLSVASIGQKSAEPEVKKRGTKSPKKSDGEKSSKKVDKEKTPEKSEKTTKKKSKDHPQVQVGAPKQVKIAGQPQVQTHTVPQPMVKEPTPQPQSSTVSAQPPPPQVQLPVLQQQQQPSAPTIQSTADTMINGLDELMAEFEADGIVVRPNSPPQSPTSNNLFLEGFKNNDNDLDALINELGDFATTDEVTRGISASQVDMSFLDELASYDK